ncbi:MAG: orotidine-5'-phosphate decarboxylase [Cyclobacteriaceae bacterium]|nr:orotidine-5'-phosphate decarboxylase [Cyclobacteriaceae bacterium HetDA_MAG_MS6]
MTRQQLFDKIKEKESFLCVGLDPDWNRLPKHLLDHDDPIFEFNRQIIDATKEYAVAYKPNIAFYEALGSKGWEALEKTIDYLPKNTFRIADAKRADIGNTSNMYAKAFFDQMDFDAITISPYMGQDSVTPFLGHERKWGILLAATSNAGSFDFQDLLVDNNSEKLYERIIRKSADWGNPNNLMYVIGATRVETLISIRRQIPEHFLLIPGVGAQGGDLEQVCKYGLNKQCGLLVNSSRGIIYASDGEDFAEAAAQVAQTLQHQMAGFLSRYLK